MFKKNNNKLSKKYILEEINDKKEKEKILIEDQNKKIIFKLKNNKILNIFGELKYFFNKIKFKLFKVILLIIFSLFWYLYIKLYLFNFTFQNNSNFKDHSNLNIIGGKINLNFFKKKLNNYISTNCIIMNNLNKNTFNLNITNEYKDLNCNLNYSSKFFKNINLNLNDSVINIENLEINNLNLNNENTEINIKNSKINKFIINGVNTNIFWNNSTIINGRIKLIDGLFNFINYNNLKLKYRSFNKNIAIRGDIKKIKFKCTKLTDQHIYRNIEFIDILVDEQYNTNYCNGIYEDIFNDNNIISNIDLKNFFGFSLFYRNNTKIDKNFYLNNKNINYFEFPEYFKIILEEKLAHSKNNSILPIILKIKILKNNILFENLFDEIVLYQNNYYVINPRYLNIIFSKNFIEKSIVNLELKLKPNYYWNEKNNDFLNIVFIKELENYIKSFNLNGKLYFTLNTNNKLNSFKNYLKKISKNVENYSNVENYLNNLRNVNPLIKPIFKSNNIVLLELFEYLRNLSITLYLFLFILFPIIIVFIIILIKKIKYNKNFIKSEFKNNYLENYNYIFLKYKFLWKKVYDIPKLNKYLNIIDNKNSYFYNLVFNISLIINKIIYSKIDSLEKYLELILKRKKYKSKNKIDFNEFKNNYEEFCHFFNYQFINFEKKYLNQILKKYNHKIKENNNEYLITNIIIKNESIKNLIFKQNKINNLKFFIENVCIKTKFEEDIVKLSEFRNHYYYFCEVNNLKIEFFDNYFLQKNYNFIIKSNKNYVIKSNNKLKNKYYYIIDFKAIDNLKFLYLNWFLNNKKTKNNKFYYKIMNNNFFYEIKKIIYLMIIMFLFFNITIYSSLLLIYFNNFYEKSNYFIEVLLNLNDWINSTILIVPQKINIIFYFVYFLAILLILNIYFYDNFFVNISSLKFTKINGKFIKFLNYLNSFILIFLFILNFLFLFLDIILVILILIFNNIIINSFFFLIFGHILLWIYFKIYFNKILKINSTKKLKKFNEIIFKNINKTFKYIIQEKKKEIFISKNNNNNKIFLYKLIKNNEKIPKNIKKLIKSFELNEYDKCKNIIFECNSIKNFEINNNLIELIDLIKNKNSDDNWEFLNIKILNIFFNFENYFDKLINKVIIKENSKTDSNNSIEIYKKNNLKNKNSLYKEITLNIIIILNKLSNEKYQEVYKIMKNKIFNKLNTSHLYLIKIINTFYFNKNNYEKKKLKIYKIIYKILIKSYNIKNNDLKFMISLFSNNNNNFINLINWKSNKFENNLSLLFPENYLLKKNYENYFNYNESKNKDIKKKKTFDDIVNFINNYKFYLNKNKYDIIYNIKYTGNLLKFNNEEINFILFLKNIKNNFFFDFIKQNIDNNIFIYKLLNNLDMNLKEFNGFINLINKNIKYECLSPIFKLICKRNNLNEYNSFIINIIILIFNDDEIEIYNSLKNLNLNFFKIFCYLKYDKYKENINCIINAFLKKLDWKKNKIKKEIFILIKSKNIKSLEIIFKNNELKELEKYNKENLLMIYLYMIIINKNSSSIEIIKVLNLIFVELKNKRLYDNLFYIILWMKINNNNFNKTNYSINSLMKNILNNNSDSIDYIINFLLNEKNKFNQNYLKRFFKNKNIHTYINYINNSINSFNKNLDFSNLFNNYLKNENNISLLIFKKIIISSNKIKQIELENFILILISKISNNNYKKQKFIEFLLALLDVNLNNNYLKLGNYFENNYEEYFLKFLILTSNMKKEKERIKFYYDEMKIENFKSKVQLFGFFINFIQNKIVDCKNLDIYLNLFSKQFNINTELIYFIKFYLNPNKKDLTYLIIKIKNKYDLIFEDSKNKNNELLKEILYNLINIINKENISTNFISKLFNIEINKINFIYNWNKLNNKKEFDENIIKDNEFINNLKYLKIDLNEINFFLKLNWNIINLKEILLFINKIKINENIDIGLFLNLLFLNINNYNKKEKINEIYDLSINVNYFFKKIDLNNYYIWMVLFNLKGDIENSKKCIKKLFIDYKFLDTKLFKFFMNIISIKNCSKLYFNFNKISFKNYNKKIKKIIKELNLKNKTNKLNYKETYLFSINKYLKINIIHLHLLEILKINNNNENHLHLLLNKIKFNIFDYIIIKNILNSNINSWYLINDIFFIISIKNYFNIYSENNNKYKKYLDKILFEIDKIYNIYFKEFKLLIFSKFFKLFINWDINLLKKIKLYSKSNNLKDEINSILLNIWIHCIDNKIMNQKYKNIILYYKNNESLNLLEDLIYKNKIKFDYDFNFEQFKDEFIEVLLFIFGNSLSILKDNINSYYKNTKNYKSLIEINNLNENKLFKGYLLGIKFIFLKINNNLENFKNKTYLFKKQNELKLFFNQKLLFDIIQKLLIFKIDIRYYKDNLFYSLYMLFNGYFYSNHLANLKNQFIINYNNFEKINKKLEKYNDIEKNFFKLNVFIFYYLFSNDNLKENLENYFHINKNNYLFIDTEDKINLKKENFIDKELYYLINLNNNNELIKMRLGFNFSKFNYDKYMDFYKILNIFKNNIDYLNDILIFKYDTNNLYNKWDNYIEFIKIKDIYKNIIKLTNIKKLNEKKVKKYFNNIKLILNSNTKNLIIILIFLFNKINFNKKHYLNLLCNSIDINDINSLNIFLINKSDNINRINLFKIFFENLKLDNNLVFTFKHLLNIYTNKLNNKSTNLEYNIFEKITNIILDINNNFNKNNIIKSLYYNIHYKNKINIENLNLNLYIEILNLNNKKIKENEKIELINYIICFNKIIKNKEFYEVFDNENYNKTLKIYFNIKNKDFINIFKLLNYYNNNTTEININFFDLIILLDFNFYNEDILKVNDLLKFLNDFKNNNIINVLKFFKDFNLENEYSFLLSNYFYLSILNNWVDETKLNKEKLNKIALLFLYNFINYFFNIWKINKESIPKFIFKELENLKTIIYNLDHNDLFEIIDKNYLKNNIYKENTNYIKKFHKFVFYIDNYLKNNFFNQFEKNNFYIKKNFIYFLNYYLFKKEFYLIDEENNLENLLELKIYNNNMLNKYNTFKDIDNDTNFNEIIKNNQKILYENKIMIDDHFVRILFKIIFFFNKINKEKNLELNENNFYKDNIEKILKNLIFEINKNNHLFSNNNKLYEILIKYIDNLENFNLKNKKIDFMNNIFNTFYNWIYIEKNEIWENEIFKEFNILNKNFNLLFIFIEDLNKHWNNKISIDYWIFKIKMIFIEFNLDLNLFYNFKYYLLLILENITPIEFLYKKNLISLNKKEKLENLIKNNNKLKNKNNFNIDYDLNLNFKDDYNKLIFILKDLTDNNNNFIKNDFKILRILFNRIKINISDLKIYQILSLNNKKSNIYNNYKILNEDSYNFFKRNLEILSELIKKNKILNNYNISYRFSIFYIIIIFISLILLFLLKYYFELFWEGGYFYPIIVNFYTFLFFITLFLIVKKKINLYLEVDFVNNFSLI